MTASIWAGEQVELRAIRPGDEDFLLRLASVCRAAAPADGSPPSRDDLLKGIEADLERKDDGRRFIIAGRDGEPAGVISVDTTPREANLELTVEVEEGHRRKGYAREAILRTLRFYFEELGYQRCEVRVAEANSAAVGLFKGLGFAGEARLRQAVSSLEGRGDLLILGLLAEEYAARCGRTVWGDA